MPTIFGYGIENIKEKIDFLISENLKNIILKKPKNLMQSVDLTYARYRYLTEERHIDIDEENSRYLFKNKKEFENTFGIDNLTLVSNYCYDKEVRRKKKC